MNLDYNQFKQMGLEWPEIKAYKLGYEYGLPYTARRYIPEGRIKANLQISEILQKIAYLKGFLLQQTKSEARKYSSAANYVENFQQDISKLSIDELSSLPIAKETHSSILEFIKENKSLYLKELEEEAYQTVSKRLMTK